MVDLLLDRPDGAPAPPASILRPPKPPVSLPPGLAQPSRGTSAPHQQAQSAAFPPGLAAVPPPGIGQVRFADSLPAPRAELGWDKSTASQATGRSFGQRGACSPTGNSRWKWTAVTSGAFAWPETASANSERAPEQPARDQTTEIACRAPGSNRFGSLHPTEGS